MVFIERHAITLLDDCLYAKPMSQTMQYPLFLVYSKFICLDIRYCILNETPSHHKWVHGVRMCLLKCGDGYFSLASTQQANCFLSDQSRRQIFPPFDLQYIQLYSMRTRAFYFNKLIVKYINTFFYYSWLIQTLHEVYILCLISQNFIDVEHVLSHIERSIYCIPIHYILDMQFLINKLSITTYNLQVVTVALAYIIVVFLE